MEPQPGEARLGVGGFGGDCSMDLGRGEGVVDYLREVLEGALGGRSSCCLISKGTILTVKLKRFEHYRERCALELVHEFPGSSRKTITNLKYPFSLSNFPPPFADYFLCMLRSYTWEAQKQNGTSSAKISAEGSL
jgi:hypothetical protein